MGDIAQRGNRLTKKMKEQYDKAYPKQAAANPAIVQDVYNVMARKHNLGAKKKPHSSKEGVTASLGRTVRDVGKILSPERVKKFGGGRTNLLEELGRVEAEPSNRNRRAEISRVHSELNKGYATGGRVGLKKGGKPWGTGPKPGTHEFLMQNLHKRKGKAKGGKADKKESKPGKAYWKAKDKKEDIRFMELMHEKKGLKKHPQSTLVGRAAMEQKKLNKDIGQTYNPYNPKSEKNPGGYTGTHPRGSIDKRLGAKKGGKADKNWIQKAVNPKHKGYCTPMTKKTCTPARKALARTFKKKAKTGW